MSFKTLIVSLIIFLFSVSKTPAQELPKNSISVNAFGVCALAGVSYERIFIERIGFEVGVGLMGIGGGLTFYPLKTKLGNLCPYSGIKSTYMVLPDVGSGAIGYIPIGITYFSNWGINLGLDLGPAFGNWQYMDIPMPDEEYEPEKIRVWGNIKIGIRF